MKCCIVGKQSLTLLRNFATFESGNLVGFLVKKKEIIKVSDILHIMELLLYSKSNLAHSNTVGKPSRVFQKYYQHLILT